MPASKAAVAAVAPAGSDAALRRYRFCGVTIASRVALPLLEPGSEADPACTIDLPAQSPDDRPRRWFHHWRIGRQPPVVSFARTAGGYVIRFRNLADIAVSGDGRRVTAYPSTGLPSDTLRHLLIDQALPLALSRQGHLMLHASAVHVPGLGAIVFAGTTGRGKSTLAAALAAHADGRILADDCLALEARLDGVVVHPSYPGIRLWPDAARARTLRGATTGRVAHYTRKRRVSGPALAFHDEPSALRALFLLGARATSPPSIAVSRCRASAALMALVRSAYLLDVEDRVDLSRAFDRLAAVAMRVPIFRLRVRDGLRWLPATANAILLRVPR